MPQSSVVHRHASVGRLELQFDTSHPSLKWKGDEECETIPFMIKTKEKERYQH